MIENKSRLPVYQTERRQAETDTQRTQPIPRPNDNTYGERVQGLFSGLLPKGAENAVSTAALLQILGMSDQRAIRKLISDERAAGAVILSNERGYFLPDDGEKGRREAEAFIATVTAKGANTIRAAKSAKTFLSVLPGQAEIE